MRHRSDRRRRRWQDNACSLGDTVAADARAVGGGHRIALAASHSACLRTWWARPPPEIRSRSCRRRAKRLSPKDIRSSASTMRICLTSCRQRCCISWRWTALCASWPPCASGETVPDAITSLWKDGYLQRLHLMPFTKEQCVTLIEVGARRPGRGLVRRSDVGVLRRQRVVRSASRRGRVGGGHAASGPRRVAAARPHRRHVGARVAARQPRRPAARQCAARAAAADVLRAARPRHA